MATRVRVYIACSLDGFIAGPGDDLSWLTDPLDGKPIEPPAVGFEEFMADVGAILMGRRTYDVVQGFEQWPYGDLPVLVPTTRPLTAVTERVRAVKGDIDSLIDESIAAADGRDVYIDGGQMIRQALEAGRIDELIVTIAPIILGEGISLFAGLGDRQRLRFGSVAAYGTMLQLTAEPIDD